MCIGTPVSAISVPMAPGRAASERLMAWAVPVEPVKAILAMRWLVASALAAWSRESSARRWSARAARLKIGNEPAPVIPSQNVRSYTVSQSAVSGIAK